MKKNHATLRCRTCSQSFRATKTPEGGWHTAFEKKPPSKICRSHRGSPLCRWEVHKLRHKLWRNIRPFFDGLPAAYVTLVPPRRTVAFDALPQMRVADEARSLRRLLKDRLPMGTMAVGIFDVSLVDDQRGRKRKRYWLPHFHVLVAGMDAVDARKLLDGLYATTEEVPRPSHIKDAPTPRNASAYSLKHVGDVKAKTIFDDRRNSGGEGKRKRRRGKTRQPKADERAIVERWARQQKLDDYLLLKGLRRFGSTVRRT